MSVQQFTVQPSSVVATVALIVLVATGIVLLLLAFTTGRRTKSRTTLVVLMVIGIAIIGTGVTVFFASNTPSTITFGSGYVSKQSPSFNAAGNLRITSSQITSAYVGQIGSGNLTLAKQHGTNYDHINVGVFTLGNGATAYVVSNNSTDFIIQLNNGKYVILGTSSTDALVASFLQSVYPIV